MKFVYDPKVVRKGVPANFFVVNSSSKFAFSSYATRTAAEENCKTRNDRVIAQGVSDRYVVCEAEEGIVAE